MGVALCWLTSFPDGRDRAKWGKCPLQTQTYTAGRNPICEWKSTGNGTYYWAEA